MLNTTVSKDFLPRSCPCIKFSDTITKCIPLKIYSFMYVNELLYLNKTDKFNNHRFMRHVLIYFNIENLSSVSIIGSSTCYYMH